MVAPLSGIDYDWNYAYALVSFIIGALAGFQAIYERYGEESGTSAATLPGLAYLFSRGIVPALFFVVLYKSHQVHSYLMGLAVGLGLGTEAVLRSQFQVKTKRPAKGTTLTAENSFIGLFNVLEWYQNFTLELIATRIAAKRQRMVHEAIRRVPQTMSFPGLCRQVETNSDALSDPKERQQIKDALAAQLTEYVAEGKKSSSGDIEDRYRKKLGFWIYHNVHGRHGLDLLFRF